MPELKPCPCGSKKHWRKIFSAGKRKQVFTECGWQGPWRDTEEEAIKVWNAAWNARADAEMLDKALDALEMLLPDCRNGMIESDAMEVLVQSGRYRWTNESHTAIERVK